ncbi:hypothetical protein FC696_05710 [Bacillus wiedmannii]|uniref:hypothetical protein n=1 Tax=Bacillus wiedmannii TaxID=1890302 RepID=UPI0010BE83E5|nr:hypothetical protein [Bacillus wiedmannii]TKI15432.1 hypothetical protein FC696_05710 [Bacillus wiedmannii]
MKKYNTSLQNLHASKRKETIDEINNAIETIELLEGPNAIITAKKILQYTNLSRSALYKEHALKIWNYKLWEKKYTKTNKIETKIKQKHQENLEHLQEVTKQLVAELQQQKNANRKLQASLKNEKKRREIKEIEIEELQIKHRRLLGECQRISDILYIKS